MRGQRGELDGQQLHSRISLFDMKIGNAKAGRMLGFSSSKYLPWKARVVK